MGDSDRPKKSWREIDATRDRGGHARRDEARDRLGLPAQRSSRQYRAALEALFDKGGLAKIAEKLEEKAGPAPGTRPAPTGQKIVAPKADEGKAALRKKLLEAIGRDEITRAADRYLKEYPLPDDFEILEQLVEHRKDDRVRETLATLDRMLAREKPKRTRVLAAKLRFLEETSDDKEIRADSARLRAKLS